MRFALQFGWAAAPDRLELVRRIASGDKRTH